MTWNRPASVCSSCTSAAPAENAGPPEERHIREITYNETSCTQKSPDDLDQGQPSTTSSYDHLPIEGQQMKFPKREERSGRLMHKITVKEGYIRNVSSNLPSMFSRLKLSDQ